LPKALEEEIYENAVKNEGFKIYKYFSNIGI
jgi:hypothetical protein